MAQTKIIKNQSGLTKQILNKDVEDGSEYNVPSNLWLELAEDIVISDLVDSEDFVVNDGSMDLPANVGHSHIKTIPGVIRDHSDITLLPAVTQNAPEVMRISDACIVFCMGLNDEIFGQSRFNNYAGGDLEIQLHMAIDNSDSDRWVQFEISYITTNGFNDHQMSSALNTLVMGPIEVPTTPWRIFESVVTIPESDLSNGEHYIYIGIKRVSATGKTAPSNAPGILRYCKRYWQKVEI